MIQWLTHKDSQLFGSCVIQYFEQIDWVMIKWFTHKDSQLFGSWVIQYFWTN